MVSLVRRVAKSQATATIKRHDELSESHQSGILLQKAWRLL
ncbi:hypothetical protein ACIQD3_00820 [Peribacillus loiseleuriae]